LPERTRGSFGRRTGFQFAAQFLDNAGRAEGQGVVELSGENGFVEAVIKVEKLFCD